MQRSVSKRFAIVMLALAASLVAACADDGVGDPCVPEAIPYNSKLAATESGGYGFASSETYLETSSVQCRTRVCIVHKLDNGTGNAIPADPRGNTCEHPRTAGQLKGCVSPEALSASVYCTCKCGGPKLSELCDCPGGFTCTTVDGLDRGGDGIRGKYCLKDVAATGI